MIRKPAVSTAAAGTTQGTAATLPTSKSGNGPSMIFPTTGANGTAGVILNAGDENTGELMFIGNGAQAILLVYPPSGGTINGAAANAAFSTQSGKGCIMYCLNGATDTWLAW